MRFIFLLILLFSLQAEASPHWYWKASFSTQEADDLKAMVKHAEDGLEALLGPLPFEYRVFFHRRVNGEEPVPWAETDKGTARDVHFHVDMSYSSSAFNDDWTAPHELSHLVFPYLGKSGRWFAEGIASYLQYQVMYANNTISWQESIDRLQDRFYHARLQGPGGMSIVDLSKVVGRLGTYVRLYWGGAAYFMQADKKLYAEKGLRLNDVIREFMHCCYSSSGHSAEKLIKIFDRISGSTIFNDTYYKTVTRSEFPETEEAMKWLAKHPPVINKLSARDP